jgi:fucose permease
LSSLDGAFWAYEKEAPTHLFEASERTTGRRVTLTIFQMFKQALKNRVTLMGALFIFSYQGAEVSISGWVISYLIEYKRGDSAHVDTSQLVSG